LFGLEGERGGELERDVVPRIGLLDVKDLLRRKR
jgi:hypothetical protein